MDDKISQIKKLLEEQESWPHTYMYKFIVPTTDENIQKVKALFADHAEISERMSSNNKYISITAKEVAMDVDQIIEKYVKAQDIEGLIAL